MPSNDRIECQDLNPTGLWVRAYGPSSRNFGKPRRVFHMPYRYGGMQKRLTFPTDDYAEASQLALEARMQLRNGVDPGVARQEHKLQAKREAHIEMVEDVVADFIRRYMKQAGPRPKAPAYIRNTERLLERFAVKAWQGRDIRAITKRDVINLTDSVVDAGHGTTANRFYQALSKLFTWCVERDLVAVSPLLGTKKPSAEIERERTLSPTELRVVWLAAKRLPYPYKQYFHMLIATGQRRSEVAKMKWANLSDDGWLIPAPDTKTKKHPHLVPISATIKIVLDECRAQRDGAYVFPGRYKTATNNFDAMKRYLDAAITEYCVETGEAVPEAWKLHDLRRSFTTLLGPLKVTRFIVSRLLNHTDNSVTGKHYDRYEYRTEKAEALERWAAWLARLTADDPDRVMVLDRISSGAAGI